MAGWLRTDDDVGSSTEIFCFKTEEAAHIQRSKTRQINLKRRAAAKTTRLDAAKHDSSSSSSILIVPLGSHTKIASLTSKTKTTTTTESSGRRTRWRRRLSQEKVNINEEGVLKATESMSKEFAALNLDDAAAAAAAKSDFHQEKCQHNDIIIGAASADHDSSSSSSSLPPGQECFPSNPSSVINNNSDPGLETNVAVEEVSYSLTQCCYYEM